MFCPNCGNQLPDNSKFCGNCGSQIGSTLNHSYSPSNNGQLKFDLDTNSIVMLITSAVMLLSMMLLPLFELNYDTNYDYKNYTISLFGDNYMAYYGIRDDIVTFTRIAFVFMLGLIIAILIFKMTMKYFYSFIAACINVGVLLIYNLYVNSVWISESRQYSPHATYLKLGNIICIACAILLVILTRKALNIKK